MHTTTTTTTTGATDAPVLDVHQCADCNVYRVDVQFVGDICDDCVPMTAAPHVDGPTVDFHE
jgi:hypothetical protein